MAFGVVNAIRLICSFGPPGLLLLVLAAKAAPVHQARQTAERQVSWNLVSGLQAGGIYAAKTATKDLKVGSAVTMKALCNLLDKYDSLTKFDSSSDLHDILEKNVEESCKFFKNITVVSTDGSGESSGGGAEMGPCSLEDWNRFRLQCIRLQLPAAVGGALQRVQQYCSGSCPQNINKCVWVERMFTSVDQQNRVKEMLRMCNAKRS